MRKKKAQGEGHMRAGNDVNTKYHMMHADMCHGQLQTYLQAS